MPLIKEFRNSLPKPIDSSICELTSNGGDYRHRLGTLVERLPVSLELLPDLNQSIFGTSPVKLVQNHNICEVQRSQLL